MKIKSSTLVLLVAAAVLGGIALIVQQQPAPPPPDSSGQVASEPERIFDFQEADVQQLTVQTQLRTLKFKRGTDNQWQMLEPEQTTASTPSIAFLLDLMATGKTQRTLTAPASDRQQFGFHQPLATIEVTLNNQQTHRLILGEYDFNRSFLYAQADPASDAQELSVLLVSPNFENAVNRPLDEWKQPATAEKSPSPSPRQSPAASPSP